VIILRLNSKILIVDRVQNFLIFAAIITKWVSYNGPVWIFMNFIEVSLVSQWIVWSYFEHRFIFGSD
jgi:hypothetical protein